MTRETKVGLAVASSFIGLVAIVVATKFHANDPESQTAQVVTPGDVAEVMDNKDGKKKDDGHKKDGKHSDRAERKLEKKLASEVALAGLQIPAPGGESRTETPAPVPPILPPTDPRDDRLSPPAPPGDLEHKKTKEALRRAMKDSEQPPPAAPGSDPSGFPPGPGAFDLNQTNPPAPMPIPVPPPPSGPTPPSGPPSGPPMGPGASPFDPPGPAPNPLVVKDSGPPPSLQIPKDAGQPPPVPVPMDPSLAPPGRDPMPLPPTTPLNVPPPPPVTPQPLPVPQVTPPLTQPKGTDIPLAPIGSNPPALGPTPGIAPVIPSHAPKVKSFDVQPYVVKPGDGSFEAISKQVYNDQSGRYAQALLQFNRDYPNADKGIQQNPPAITPGQKVFIPSIDFLEQHYASAVGATTPPVVGGPQGTRPLAGPTIPDVSPTVPGIVVPMQDTARPPMGSVIPPTQPVQPPTSDAFKRYRVPDQGQHILDIAQRTLGDRGRWSEIYRLNPNVPPQFPVPGGTELRLPANAVVP